MAIYIYIYTANPMNNGYILWSKHFYLLLVDYGEIIAPPFAYMVCYSLVVYVIMKVPTRMNII